jgi:hypothetical protein
MAVEVVFGEDPGWVLHEAGTFLASDPVRHNLILTLLHTRVAYPEPGRYWVARDSGAVVGLAFQSPVYFFASVTPTRAEAVAGLVEAIVEAGVNLPGVNGEAATAARFAGQWTERRGLRQRPIETNARGRAPLHPLHRPGKPDLQLRVPQDRLPRRGRSLTLPIRVIRSSVHRLLPDPRRSDVAIVHRFRCYSSRVVPLSAWFSKPSRRARRSTWGPRSCRAFWVK